MRTFQIRSVLADPALAAEVAAALGQELAGDGSAAARAVSAGRRATAPAARTAPSGSASRGAPARGTPAGVAPAPLLDSEAAAMAGWLARPALALGDRTFEAPVAGVWQARLFPTGRRLVRAAASVGRIEVDGSADPLGSGWMVARGVVATSPTVAAAVTLAQSAGQVVRISFAARALGVGPPGLEVASAENARDGAAVGLLRLVPADEEVAPPPLALLDAAPQDVPWVALLSCPWASAGEGGGPPERGGRPSGADKRLAPGRWRVDGHDAAAGPGSEGGALVDLASGAVVGLHLADGRGGPHPVLAARGLLAGLVGAVPTAAPVLQLGGAGGDGAARSRAIDDSAAATRAVVGVERLAGRAGYQEDFLGAGDRRVPLPTVPAALARSLVVVDAATRGTKRFVLAYEHYSSVMHAPRRMPLFTATNIDGAQSQAIKRSRDNWSLDPRIPAAAQWGAELYSGNDLDRGHLTRRLDPAWGPTAKVAETDTFFYTNACPQQHRFNDGIWGDLEDYLLHNADTLDFRACVFTGPVFGDADLPYRGALIPLRFWKVAVMVHAERAQLSATGYLLSQADLVGTRDFVFGQFRTYQVPLENLEELTGLRWTAMRPFDPLAAPPATGVSRGRAARVAPRELQEIGDIVL